MGVHISGKEIRHTLFCPKFVLPRLHTLLQDPGPEMETATHKHKRKNLRRQFTPSDKSSKPS